MCKKRKIIDLVKGKKMFYECIGNTMFLDREYGLEYRNCNIPKNVEIEWTEEIKQELVESIKQKRGEEKTSSINKLVQIISFEERLIIIFFVLRENYLDTFSRIIICESLCRERKNCRNTQEVKQIQNILFYNKNKMLNEPIDVDESYKNDPYMKNYNFSEENLINRINAISLNIFNTSI